MRRRGVYREPQDGEDRGGRGACGDFCAHNDARRVRDFCAAYALDADAVVALEDRLGDERKEPLPAQQSVAQLLTQVLDLFGRPKRSLCDLPDDAERLKLEQLAQGCESEPGSVRNQIEAVFGGSSAAPTSSSTCSCSASCGRPSAASTWRRCSRSSSAHCAGKPAPSSSACTCGYAFSQAVVD